MRPGPVYPRRCWAVTLLMTTRGNLFDMTPQAIATPLLAYPNADEVVEDLLERKEPGLDHNGQEVNEIVGNVPDGCQAAEEEGPSPQIEVHCSLQQHTQNFTQQFCLLTVHAMPGPSTCYSAAQRRQVSWAHSLISMMMNQAPHHVRP